MISEESARANIGRRCLVDYLKDFGQPPIPCTITDVQQDPLSGLWFIQVDPGDGDVKWFWSYQVHVD